VARGTQHRKRRTPTNARVAAAPPKEAPKKRVKHERWEDQLFFSRLRVHAKWVFVFLALVFGVGFVVFGVGSGSTGISDVLQNFFTRNSSSSGSVTGLEKKVREHPKDASAWRDLATKLEQDQKTTEAIAALNGYIKLRPRDENALEELAGLYSRRADDYRTEAATAQQEAALVAPGALFQPPSSTTFGRLYQDPNALQDPISNAATSQANTKASDAYSKLTTVEKQAVAVYKKLIVLNPDDATRQVQLGEAAQNAGDTKTAIAAYKKFLKLAPDDPLASAVKEQLKALTGSSTTTAKAG
jgi:cytochrome c-type biogenesis protein CcmH/NrfG